MPALIDPAGRPLKVAKQEPAAKDASAPASRDGHVKDATIASFTADVLDASMDVPVIVDFWAPWCGPCKQLGPHLERAVEQAKGAVKLVKVNIDENPEIAQQLRIQSIPTVYAFRKGQPVDGFMGAIPESQVKTFVQNLIGGAAGKENEPSIAEALDAAADALAAKDLSTAAQIYGHILQDEPGQPNAVAGLARCYLESGDFDRARKTLLLVKPDSQGHEAIRAIEAELSLKERAAAAGDLGPLRARIAANPADLQARFDLAQALDGKGAREDAIEQLLEIIRHDRKWNDDAARKHLVTVFEAMGPTDARTIAARRKLSTILFS